MRVIDIIYKTRDAVMQLELSEKTKTNYIYCGFGPILNFFTSRGEEFYSPETLALFVKTAKENYANRTIPKASFQTMRKAARWIEECLLTGRVSQRKLRKYNFACAPPEFEKLLSQYQIHMSATLQAKGNGGQSLNYINPVAEPLIYDARGNGDGITSPTMTGDHNSRVTDYTAITLQGDTVAGALLARDYKGPGRADSLGRVIAQPVGADLYNGTLTGDKAVTLTTATGQGGANTGPSVIEKIIRWIVRRLTPTECERLQGYPDGWTDLGEWIDSKGKTHKDADTPRYKALGNSIALPQWYYVLGGIADRLPDNATLGSLFDGIGGFPYVWAQLHAGRKELCVWASEIEEFPIAVTKKWFPEVEDGKLF